MPTGKGESMRENLEFVKMLRGCGGSLEAQEGRTWTWSNED